jgi:hypothetical protein
MNLNRSLFGKIFFQSQKIYDKGFKIDSTFVLFRNDCGVKKSIISFIKDKGNIALSVKNRTNDSQLETYKKIHQPSIT